MFLKCDGINNVWINIGGSFACLHLCHIYVSLLYAFMQAHKYLTREGIEPANSGVTVSYFNHCATEAVIALVT